MIPLMFPKVPQSSRPESLGFPSYPLPLNTNPPLRTLLTLVHLAESISEFFTSGFRALKAFSPCCRRFKIWRKTTMHRCLAMQCFSRGSWVTSGTFVWHISGWGLPTLRVIQGMRVITIWFFAFKFDFPNMIQIWMIYLSTHFLMDIL